MSAEQKKDWLKIYERVMDNVLRILWLALIVMWLKHEYVFP
jgi:hypothetical protein